MQVRLSLEVQQQVDQFPMELIDDFREERHGRHADGAGERAQATRALRTAEVAGSRRLKSDLDRLAEGEGPFSPLGPIEGAVDQGKVPELSKRKRPEEEAYFAEMRHEVR